MKYSVILAAGALFHASIAAPTPELIERQTVGSTKKPNNSTVQNHVKQFTRVAVPAHLLQETIRPTLLWVVTQSTIPPRHQPPRNFPSLSGAMVAVAT